MIKRRAPVSFAAFAALVLWACGHGEPQADDFPAGTDRGGIALRLSSAGLASSGVVRATVTIGPGSGPVFTPIIAALSQDAGEWTASISEVPAGRQRAVDVVAYDASGIVQFRGGTTVDIAAGARVATIVLMEQVTPPAGRIISNPLVSLALSAGTVVPGGTATLTSQVTDPQGQALSYAWIATCGTFGDPTKAVVLWTAPNLPYQRCQLTFTATNPYASTSVDVGIDVQADPSTVVLRGSRVASCWQDPLPGSVTPMISSYPAPDTATLAPPDALIQSSPSAWTRYSGGYVDSSGIFHTGSFDPQGRYAIPGIPPSSSTLLWFRDSSGVLLLVQTPEHAVDLGYDYLGRCEPPLASAQTSLSLQLSLLASWDSSSSELQIGSSGANTALSVASGTALAQGANTASLSVGWANDPLLQVPDVLFIQQLGLQVHPSGFVYRSSIATAQVTQIGQANAASTTVATALSAVSQTGALAVQQWTPMGFEQTLSDMAPPARVAASSLPAHRLSVSASPFALRYPAPPLAGGPLQLATFDLPAQTVAVGLGTPIAYGQFLPSWWAERREVRYAVAVGYQAPSATDTHYEVSSVSEAETMPAAPGTIAPTLTPARNPAINGNGALSDLTLVGTTPTFSWQPPITGAPKVYELDIFSLQAVAGSSLAQPVARYFTTSISASIPPGVLTAGTTYFARITAIANDVPYLSAPLRYSPVGARATAYTGTFTP